MKILVVLDGIAEDEKPGELTSLQEARTPFLDALCKRSRCGLFDPVDSETAEAQTDLIIASILGIRPAVWPGRAYFEVLSHLEFSCPPQVCGVVYFRAEWPGQAANYLAANQESLAELAARLGFHVHLRSHERDQSSLLVWKPENDRPDANGEEWANLLWMLEQHLPNGFSTQIEKRWARGAVFIPSLALQPAFFGLGRGSLPGLCRAAGVSLIQSGGLPFDLERRESDWLGLKTLVSAREHRLGIIYFKDPDWASHNGERLLKVRLIEWVDRMLEKVLAELRAEDEVLLISDHRTNIGSEKSSLSPSLFLHHKPTSEPMNRPAEFHEPAFERCHKGAPLTMEELNRQFLGMATP